MRQRKCSNPEPQYGGMSCLGDDTESRNCDHEQTCCKFLSLTSGLLYYNYKL